MEKTNGYDYAFHPTPECINNSLTKREVFAIQLQCAFISQFGAKYENGSWHAEEAIKAADALIDALNKKED